MPPQRTFKELYSSAFVNNVEAPPKKLLSFTVRHVRTTLRMECIPMMKRVAVNLFEHPDLGGLFLPRYLLTSKPFDEQLQVVEDWHPPNQSLRTCLVI